MAKPDLPPDSFDLIWSEGAFYNIGIACALDVCRPLLRAGGYLAFTVFRCWYLRPPVRGGEKGFCAGLFLAPEGDDLVAEEGGNFALA